MLGTAGVGFFSPLKPQLVPADGISPASQLGPTWLSDGACSSELLSRFGESQSSRPMGDATSSIHSTPVPSRDTPGHRGAEQPTRLNFTAKLSVLLALESRDDAQRSRGRELVAPGCWGKRSQRGSPSHGDPLVQAGSELCSGCARKTLKFHPTMWRTCVLSRSWQPWGCCVHASRWFHKAQISQLADRSNWEPI